MPLGLGAPDAQGQWRYGELDDAGGLASDLLDLGQSRVSSGFLADRNRLNALELLQAKMPRIIASGVFTAASRVNIDALTGFDEYTITLDMPTASVANDVTVHLRANAIANTTANYDRQTLGAANASDFGAFAAGATSWTGTNVGPRQDKSLQMTITGLNALRRTHANLTSNAFDPTANFGIQKLALRQRQALAFNGIAFTTTVGTITGSWSVLAVKY